MDVAALQLAEKNLLSEWCSGRRGFIPDGVVDWPAIAAARRRIVFLLKEPNDPNGGGWSLTEHVAATGVYWRTWSNLARWTSDLLADAGQGVPLPPGPLSAAQRARTIRPAAFVNVKKMVGGATTDRESLYAAARTDAAYIRRQLLLYSADLLVCCGDDVWNALEAHVLAGSECPLHGVVRLAMGKKAARMEGGSTVLNFWHPQARRPTAATRNALHAAMKELHGLGFLSARLAGSGRLA